MSKRTRRQRECRAFYEAAGFETFTPDATMYNDNDIFNLYDILAVRPNTTPRLIQVSTNANGRLDWFKESFRHTECGFEVIYAQVYSREGWRLMRPTDAEGNWETVCDDREHGGPMGAGVTEYLEADV